MRADSEPWLVPMRIARPSALHFSTSGVKVSRISSCSQVGHTDTSCSVHSPHTYIANHWRWQTKTIVPYLLAGELGRVVVVDHVKGLAPVGKVACREKREGPKEQKEWARVSSQLMAADAPSAPAGQDLLKRCHSTYERRTKRGDPDLNR